ncbi:MAG: ROK family protein [Rikenellaceae bacterium]|jgi:glucokinase|nr:ROK family protein [Rikenellaceae bacterium]
MEIAAGVDIGGTNTVFGLVDRQGKVHREGSVSTVAYKDVDAYVDALCGAIREQMAGFPEGQLIGMGIGAPNANFYKGSIDHAANLPWKGEIAFADKVRRYFPGIPVVLTNDANAAAVGEMVYGAARGMKDFIEVTLGTGVGSGFVAGGRLIYGHDSYAGEFGHVITVPGGRDCGCGRRGCLETYTSATGIVRTAFEMMASMREPSRLRDVTYNEMTSRLVCELAGEGDPVALAVFERTGELLGRALADAVAITSPEAIFLFGGLARAGELIFEPVRRHMEANLLANYKGRIQVLPSGLMDANVAVLGASSLAWVAE